MNPVICCIGYNRPQSMRRLLNSVGGAIYDDKDILLVISIDESSESDAVEEVARDFQWEYGQKKIIRYPARLGLKEHCLRCGDLSAVYGAVVFLEDDVVVAPGYFRYLKQAIQFYENDDKVIGISLYSERWVQDLSLDFIPAHNGNDTYYNQRELSHGQCWLKKPWLKFRDWYDDNKDCIPVYNKNVPPCVYSWKKESSWSKFISHFMAEEDMYYICPYFSFATNMSEVGTHALKTTDMCQIPLSLGVPKEFRFAEHNNSVVYDAFYERKDSFVSRINNIEISKICIDLNGLKYDWSGYDFILTIKTLPYTLIKEYGVNMDPIENNIIYNVSGHGIRLYKIPHSYVSPMHVEGYQINNLNIERISHIYNKVPSRIIFRNLVERLKRRIFEK